MSKFQRVLCPVDLSENSCAAIELATTVAKQNGAVVSFLYVSQLWLPDDSQLVHEYSHYAEEVVDEEKAQLNKLRPTDPSVGYEHQFIHGNPGPTIVNATKAADFVVLNTHGRSGVMRFLMGSVAHYVLRNSKCPVVLVKGMEIGKDEGKEPKSTKQKIAFVTDVMHHVASIHTFDGMESVLADLRKARETAAPVVDGSGECIGILTTTDIEKFQSLRERFVARDETVIDEIFEVDEFGQRRATNYNFDKVERHMTKEVISISESETVQQAIDLLETHQNIHHLVVLDADCHAVGILDVESLSRFQLMDSASEAEPDEISQSSS
ncbi:MAG: universal stress protein [Mariniblastus sp.]